MALKYPGEGFALFLGRPPEMNSSGGIAGAITVLSSRIAIIDRSALNTINQIGYAQLTSGKARFG